MNISELQLNNMMIAVTTALQPLIRALPVTPVEWADQNYYLPKESSYVDGEWKTLPFQVAIMNSMGNDRITSITPDARPATSQAEASVTVEMSLSYYRQAVDGLETICIIPEEFVRRINGVNVLADLKKIIRV